MATYVAFLRAINLGATRKFPKAAIVAATEAAGGTDVATWINTGNVRLESTRRSTDTVATALQQAYRAAAGFEVPTVVLTLPQLREVVADADRCAAEHPETAVHYVSLLTAAPAADAAAAFEERWSGPERARVCGRAVHLLLPHRDGYHSSPLTNATVERTFGVATSRNVRVIRTIAERWA